MPGDTACQWHVGRVREGRPVEALGHEDDKCDLHDLLEDHGERLFQRLSERLCVMQEELVERLTAPPGASSAPSHRQLSPEVSLVPAQRSRPSLGSEILWGRGVPALATQPSALVSTQSSIPPARLQVSEWQRHSVSSSSMARFSTMSRFASKLPTPRAVFGQLGPVSSASFRAAESEEPSAEEVKDEARASVGERQSIAAAGAFAESFQETGRLHRFVGSRAFEVGVGFAIFVNAIVIGIQTDFVANQESDDGAPLAILDITGVAFGFLFTIELALRLYVYRLSFFTDYESWRWNVADAFMVACFLGEVVASLCLGDRSERSVESQSLVLVRILRIARLFRVVRVVRIVRCVRSLRTMMCQLISTLQPLLWALVLLCLIMYTFAIVFTQITVLYRSSHFDVSAELEAHWSTLPRCMLSLFKTITNGADWDTLLRPLEDIGAGPVILYLAYIAFAQFALLNILTGVFCQNAIETVAHDQELVSQEIIANKSMHIENMRQLFKGFDADRDGSVTIADFIEHLGDEGVRAYFDSLELDTTDVFTLFRLMDIADHDELSVDDFVAGCMRLKGYAKSMDVAKLSFAQTAIAKRLARFMERTDQTLACLLDRLGGPGERRAF